jgi:hypothetical protein
MADLWPMKINNKEYRVVHASCRDVNGIIYCKSCNVVNPDKRAVTFGKYYDLEFWSRSPERMVERHNRLERYHNIPEYVTCENASIMLVMAS